MPQEMSLFEFCKGEGQEALAESARCQDRKRRAKLLKIAEAWIALATAILAANVQQAAAWPRPQSPQQPRSVTDGSAKRHRD
jgi:hypothetical protein